MTMMLGRLIPAAILTCCAALVTTSDAQEPPTADPASCCVRLYNGNRICGQFVEQKPGKFLTLRLASGEKRALEWTDFDSRQLQGETNACQSARATERSATVPLTAEEVTAAFRKPPPAMAPPQPQWAEDSDEPPPSSHIRVFIESKDPNVELHQLAESNEELIYNPSQPIFDGSTVVAHTDPEIGVVHHQLWEKVCGVPCGQVVLRHPYYRIDGPGLVSSYNFSLNQYPGETIRLKVQTASAKRLLGRIFLAIGGGLLLGAGVTSLALGEYRNDNRLRGVGYPLTIGGAAIGVAGFIWAIKLETVVRLGNGKRVLKVLLGDRLF